MYYAARNGVAAVCSRPFGTDKGNEDGALVAVKDDKVLLAVADGVGGLPQGEKAARVALETLAEIFHKDGRIVDAFEQANQAVCALGGPASTLVAALLDGDSLHTFNAGDSQALVVSGRGRLKAETMPHNVVGYGTEAGLIDEDDAQAHPERHVVTNALGDKVLRFELASWGKLAVRDTIVLASDGLFDNLSTSEVADIIRKSPLDKAACNLVDKTVAAMESGDEGTKPDDLTVLVWRRGQLTPKMTKA